MCHCLPTYALCGSLIAGGMNWYQALFTIGLGNLLVLIPILLIAQPGTKYGIPFPVLARSSFGTWGANVPAMLRALVACGVRVKTREVICRSHDFYSSGWESTCISVVKR